MESPARGREGFDAVLTWLRDQLPALIGSDVVRISPVGYQERPFSYVTEIMVTPADGSPARRLFVKVFKSTGTEADIDRMRRRIVHDFERTREIQRAMSAWPELGVVNPVAYNLDHLATVTEGAPGRPLLDELQVHAAWFSRASLDDLLMAMDRIGRWLRVFQTTGASGEMVSLESIREYVGVRLRKLTALPAAAFNEGDRTRVLAYVDRVGATVEQSDLRQVPIHADLAPGNVLVAPDRVTVLDFAMVTTGTRVHDLSRLVLQIELMGLKPQIRGAVLARANQTVMRAYDAELTAERPIFRLLSLLHRINHFLTLSTHPGAFPARAYNWHIRRYHRGWIERELRG